MSNRYNELSHCGRYVAEVDNSSLLLVKNIDGEVLHSFSLLNVVREFIGLETNTISVSQLSWELVNEVKTAISSKLVVVIDDFNLAVIFDIRRNSLPIIIQQSSQDGIEKVQWIPPTTENNDSNEIEDVEVSKNQQAGGYVNSKQLVIFTKNYLKVKLYSLDCTHILWQIIKPLHQSVIIRPKGDMWSIIANTREYNQPPVVYHFKNTGSISTLIHKYRFPVQLDSFSDVFQWSSDGKWLCWFSNTENLFGFNLQVLPLLGYGDPVVGKPVVSINWLEDGIKLVDYKKADLMMSSKDYFCCWLQKDILVTSINNNRIQFLLVNMNLLRISYRFEIQMSTIKNIWRQTNDSNGIKYRNIPHVSMATPLKNVISSNQCVVLQLANTVIVYELSIDNNNKMNPKLDLQTCINVSLEIIAVKIYDFNDKNEVIIFTSDHVLVFREGIIRVLYQTDNSRIENGYVKVDDNVQILFLITSFTGAREWEILDLDITKEPPKRKFSEDETFQKQTRRKLLEGLINTSLEITDTFATRKRANESSET